MLCASTSTVLPFNRLNISAMDDGAVTALDTLMILQAAAGALTL
jgi:hypothetical protein